MLGLADVLDIHREANFHGDSMMLIDLGCCSGEGARGRGRGRVPRKPQRALKRIYREDSDEDPSARKTGTKPWEQKDSDEDVLLSSIWC